ncbi:MAG: N5-glutamine S-adenosyl-L-methionine-dependent methyltransferase [Methanoregula sp. PtaU1.Bin051]|nr:MAG: N5-glutamine S-adenosyl-L-methionine-dependent methyltransferase [Methanoregula sp. PtaU1.Bin051]
MEHDPAQVYTPADDTFLLLDAARQEARPRDSVLEIGTGSGYIAGELRKAVRRVVATEINPHAAASAREQGIDVIRTDLFAGVRGTFDLIIFNPPYLPTAPEERIGDWLEYALDGGISGREVIARFLSGAGRVLAPGGRILLLISSLTGLPNVTGIAFEEKYYAEVVRDQVVEGERLYVIRLKRNGKS